MKKNDIIELSIDNVTSEGQGVGRYMGMAVFVPASAPGDVLLVKILKVMKRYAYGKIESIITASDSRIPPDCPVYNKCGGCCYRHISYDTELKIKEGQLKDALERIGGLKSIKINSIQAAPQRNRYRNKCLLPLAKQDKLVMGFYAPHSHRIVDCHDCLLQPDIFSRISEIFRTFVEDNNLSIYDESSHTGLIRRLFLRYGNGGVMVCIVINGQGFDQEQQFVKLMTSSFKEIKSIVINSNTKITNVALGEKNRCIYGSGSIEDELCGLKFIISPLSFYQVNRYQTERLYEKAIEYAALTGKETVLDLYCGTGTIGLSMAAKAKSVIGVEIVADAVENARENARINGIKNAEFICGDAAYAVAQLKGNHPDVIILDPPRKGCDINLLELLPDFNPDRIVYISCNPATLARDLKLLEEKGYQAMEATPFDLFPSTSHVETAVLLSHKDI